MIEVNAMTAFWWFISFCCQATSVKAATAASTNDAWPRWEYNPIGWWFWKIVLANIFTLSNCPEVAV